MTLTGQKTIRWNHLHLLIPDNWECIIKAPRHLILERQLKPFLEIRWQPAEKTIFSDQRERIQKRFAKEIQRPIRLLQTDKQLNNLASSYTIQAFNWDQSHGAQMLHLTCRTCAANILIRCYQGALTWLTDNPFVLDNLTCHLQPGETDRWLIQDIAFAIPEGFILDSCSFTFGLSNLLFMQKKTHLRLCRLAPASEHLKQNSFSSLFESFCSAPPEKQNAIDTQTLSYSRTPNLAEQFFSAIRRTRPYRSAWFNHYLLHDRILGYQLQSQQPIDNGMEMMIKDSYGIIQKEEANSDTHA